MLNGFLKKFSLITTVGAGGLILGSCSSPQSEKSLDQTPITVNIPSKISNEILSITLPKCAFKLNNNEIKKNNITRDEVSFNFEFQSYSGNLKNDFNCVDKNSDFISQNRINPIYPLPVKDGVNSGLKYLIRLNNVLGQKILEKNEFVERRFANASEETLLISGMPHQTTPFQFFYFKFNGTYNHAPTYTYSVTTILKDKFEFRYTFYILTPKNRNGHNLPNYNTEFAEKFRDILQQQKNVLDYPAVIQEFVDNNERVVQYINENSRIINN